MFSSPAFASAGAAPSGAAAIINLVGPFVLVLGIFWFLIMRPQQRRLKQHREMLAAVKKNDTAVTTGGLIGKVTRVDEAEVELEVAANVRVRVVKTMLSEVRPHGAKPAND
jgi:preprotein translocase subunit YajC